MKTVRNRQDCTATLVLVFREKCLTSFYHWSICRCIRISTSLFSVRLERKNNHISTLLIFQLIYELHTFPVLFLATFLPQLHFYRTHLVHYGSWFLLNYFWDRKWWYALICEDKLRRRKGGKGLGRSHLFKLQNCWRLSAFQKVHKKRKLSMAADAMEAAKLSYY